MNIPEGCCSICGEFIAKRIDGTYYLCFDCLFEHYKEILKRNIELEAECTEAYHDKIKILHDL